MRFGWRTDVDGCGEKNEVPAERGLRAGADGLIHIEFESKEVCTFSVLSPGESLD